MKKITIYTVAALLLAATVSLRAAEQMTRYDTRGGKLRLEGTSNVHDWRALSPLILGYLEVGPGFPAGAGQDVKPGKIEARGKAIILTRTLISKKENWVDNYENKMDDNIYKGLKADTPAGSNIVFQVTELILKEAPKSKDAPYLFDSKGELAIAGVTNQIFMPVSLSFVPDEAHKITKLKISGSTPVKMSDYKVKTDTILEKLGFTVGDEVKVSFDWMLAPSKPASAAAASK